MRNLFRNRFALPAFLALTVLLAAGKEVQAQTGTFYFTAQGSTTPITSMVTTGQGQIINLSVYFQYDPGTTTFAPNSINAFVGYDKTTSEGTSASPLDGVLVLNGDTGTSASSAVSNVNSTFTSLYFGGQLGGGQPSSASVNAVRPYGDDLSFGTSPGTSFSSTAATRLFDISLKNVNLTSGSETVSLYSSLFHTITNSDSSISVASGPGSDFSTYLTDGAFPTPTVVTPATYNLTITAAPEPAQTATLGLVGLGLAGLMLRARKRGKASG